MSDYESLAFVVMPGVAKMQLGISIEHSLQIGEWSQKKCSNLLVRFAEFQVSQVTVGRSMARMAPAPMMPNDVWRDFSPNEYCWDC